MLRIQQLKTNCKRRLYLLLLGVLCKFLIILNSAYLLLRVATAAIDTGFIVLQDIQMLDTLILGLTTFFCQIIVHPLTVYSRLMELTHL